MRAMIIAIVLMITAGEAMAGAAYLGAWSEHFAGDGYDYNDNHELVAVESGGWIVGTYKNSYYDRGHLVGYGWDLGRVDDWRLRLYTGATHGYRGYRFCINEICPALVPELSYTRYRIQPTVMLVSDAVAVAVKFKF